MAFVVSSTLVGHVESAEAPVLGAQRWWLFLCWRAVGRASVARQIWVFLTRRGAYKYLSVSTKSVPEGGASRTYFDK